MEDEFSINYIEKVKGLLLAVEILKEKKLDLRNQAKEVAKQERSIAKLISDSDRKFVLEYKAIQDNWRTLSRSELIKRNEKWAEEGIVREDW